MTDTNLLDFANKVNEIMPLMIREFARRQINELFKGKITLPQFLLLEFLQKEGESRMTDVAHFINVTTAAVTGIVERLVRDGYLVRSYDTADRRIIRVNLTAKGNALIKKMDQQRREMVIDIFGKMSEPDRRDYLRILLKIKEILQKEKAKLK
jgi:DNA-binding MarR family transcriptional regulator